MRWLWISLACTLIVLVGTACKAPTPAPAPDQALYVQYCGVCHGEDGRSKPDMLSTPHLSNQAFLQVVDDAFLFENIARGRPGPNGRGRPGTKMAIYSADYGGPLTNDQIRQIVGFIRRWQTQPSIPLDPFTAAGDVAAGAKVYTTNCEACHGKDGWADKLAPSLAGQTFQQTASDAYIRHMARNGRMGTTMAAFTLTDQQVNDLVTYVRSLYTPAAP
jgi:cytochrome c oxidase cbb3-type subunit III